MSDYEDILNLPHHVSRKHPQMSMLNRAAQFSPFAALTGYDAAIRETARQTDRRIALREDEKTQIGEKLHLLKEMEVEHPLVTFVYFVPDDRKEGGKYVSRIAKVKRIDGFNRIILLMDGQSISIDDLLEVNCELFDSEGGSVSL